MEYVTIADARAQYGDLLADRTDDALQRLLDRFAAIMEDGLGHTFGRALIARSTDPTHTVEIAADRLTIGGDAYPFDDYPTLYALSAAANGAGQAYALDLLPQISSDTPSTSLVAVPARACGGGYAARQALDVAHLFHRAAARATSTIFLPLPIQTVSQVVENGAILDSSAYWATPGDLTLIRKACACAQMSGCSHDYGRWRGDTVTVLYTPRHWRNPPAICASAILEALGASLGLGALESESFGPHSYRRKLPDPVAWQHALSDAGLRPYAARLVIGR